MTTKSTGWILLLGVGNVCIISIAQMSGSFIVIMASMIVYLLTILLSNDETIFPLILFFLPWSPILKFSPSSISFYSISTILIFAKYLIKKPAIQLKTLVIWGAIVIFTATAKILHGHGITINYLMFLGMLFAFPFLFAILKEKVDFEKCIECFSVGIILATIIPFVFHSNENIMQYVDIIEQTNIGITRRSGLYGDPNFYSAQVVTALGGVLLIIENKKKNIFFDWVLLIALVFGGGLSLSKSFLLCTALIVALWWLFILWNKPLRAMGLLGIACVAFFMALRLDAFKDIVRQYIIRFSSVTDTSSLTTERSELWVSYLQFLLNNPKGLFFGQGVTNVFVNERASHNTIIEIVYQLGICGVLILIAWFALFKNDERGRRSKFWIVWVLGCFSMWLGLDLLFFDDFFVTVFLFAIGNRYLSKISSQKTE